MIDGTSFNWALNNVIGFSALEWNEWKKKFMPTTRRNEGKMHDEAKLEPIWMSIAVIAYDLWCWINLYFRFFLEESMRQLQVNETKNHTIGNGLNAKVTWITTAIIKTCAFHLVFLTWFPCLIKHQRIRATKLYC